MSLSQLTENRIKEISEVYPSSRIIKLGLGSLGSPDIIFIWEQKYSGKLDQAKFYAEMIPACFIRADIYKGKEYLYTIGTRSGRWQERLDELKKAVKQVAKEGLEAISEEVDEEVFGVSEEPSGFDIKIN